MPGRCLLFPQRFRISFSDLQACMKVGEIVRLCACMWLCEPASKADLDLGQNIQEAAALLCNDSLSGDVHACVWELKSSCR